MESVNVRPTKKFFIDMLTVDIRLEHAILDLVDNSIDALVRSRNLQLTEDLLLAGGNGQPQSNLPKISIDITPKSIVVKDDCGGITRRNAIDNVFRIGKVIPTESQLSIGVYGIGLKRAIFKIGNSFILTSRTKDDAFVVELENIDKWAEDDSPVWEIPLRDAPPQPSGSSAGTELRITNLREPVRRRIQEGTLLASLMRALQETYCFFLDKFVTITLNKQKVPATPLYPVGESDRLQPAIEYLDMPDLKVRATILAGIGQPEQGEWSASKAGWYIICNGRVVVSAEKTELTGWGTKFLPQFHSSKHRAFLGLVFFSSEYPSALPWTTTKRSINQDSIAFQRAQPHMAKVGKEVLAFINRWYPSEAPEEPAERLVAASVQPKEFRTLTSRQAQAFSAQVSQARSINTIRIQFDASLEEIERAKRCLGKRWSGAKIGRHAFDYFLRRECGND